MAALDFGSKQNLQLKDEQCIYLYINKLLVFNGFNLEVEEGRGGSGRTVLMRRIL